MAAQQFNKRATIFVVQIIDEQFLRTSLSSGSWQDQVDFTRRSMRMSKDERMWWCSQSWMSGIKKGQFITLNQQWSNRHTNCTQHDYKVTVSSRLQTVNSSRSFARHRLRI